jgi:hypothetical protein
MSPLLAADEVLVLCNRDPRHLWIAKGWPSDSNPECCPVCRRRSLYAIERPTPFRHSRPVGAGEEQESER